MPTRCHRHALPHAWTQFLVALRGERGPRAKLAAMRRLKEVQRAKGTERVGAGSAASMPPPPALQAGHHGAQRSDSAVLHRSIPADKASTAAAKPSRAVNPARLVRSAAAEPAPASSAQRPPQKHTASKPAASPAGGAGAGSGALPQGVFDDGVSPASDAAAAPPTNALGLDYDDDSGDEADSGAGGDGGRRSAEGKGGDGGKAKEASAGPQNSIPQGFFDSKAEDDQARGVDRAAEAAEAEACVTARCHPPPCALLTLCHSRGCSNDWEQFTSFARKVATQAEEEEAAEAAMEEEREHRDSMHQR